MINILENIIRTANPDGFKKATCEVSYPDNIQVTVGIMSGKTFLEIEDLRSIDMTLVTKIRNGSRKIINEAELVRIKFGGDATSFIKALEFAASELRRMTTCKDYLEG